MSHVEIRGLAKAYGETSVFKGIDLSIAEGEMCVLVGPSGCGKTTLLRSVAGLALPDAGSITIAGRDVTRLPPKDRGVGMVFQQYALFPNMTVEGNLAFGLEQRGLPRAQIAQRVAAMIDVMELTQRARAKPGQLSGGQRQRVALARALVLEPRLLLLDEPMSALDAQIRKRLREDLKRLQRDIGFTAMFVTHDQEEAMVLGDQIAVMHAGSIAQIGAPHEVYNDPRSRIVANFLGSLNVLEPADVSRIFGVSTKEAWAIHPEALAVSDGAARGETFTFAATIGDRHSLGSIVRYNLQTAGAPIRMDHLNRPGQPPLERGQAVDIAVARSMIRRLAD